MRYYELTVTGDGGDYLLDPTGLGFTQGSGPMASSLYTAQTAGTSALVGQVNPNALNLEFDLPVTQMHEPQGGAWIRLWGIGIRAVGQASNLNAVNGVLKAFVLKAGMSKGLPLANPQQAGIIAQGQVLQAFGNWEGTNQTLDLIVQAGPLPPAEGAGISFNWLQGVPVADAIAATISQAMPGYTANINVSQNLIAPKNLPAWHPGFTSWAEWLKEYTKSLGGQQFGAQYPGVQIAIGANNTVNVYDGQGPTAQTPFTLAFQDLIGQPVWVSPNEVTFPTVTRADLDIQDQIKFPAGILPPFALTSPGAAYPNTPAASSISFQGSFQINEIHHYGNYRDANASSWNSTFKVIAV